MSTAQRPLRVVIGVGNPDRGDDGVGVKVAQALEGRLPPGVALRTRTGDMLALIEDWAGYDHAICVDAAAPINAPGRIHRIDIAHEPLPSAPSLASSHGIGLAEAVSLAQRIGAAPRTLVVYAIEGSSFDLGAPLTPAVADAVAKVAARVLAEVKLLDAETAHA